MAIKCPRCKQAGSTVEDTEKRNSDHIYRRRKCRHCGKEYKTYERIDPIYEEDILRRYQMEA